MNTLEIIEGIENNKLLSYEKAHYHVVNNATCFLFDQEDDQYETKVDYRAHDDLLDFLENAKVSIHFHNKQFIFAAPFWNWLNQYGDECESIFEERETARELASN